jgi:hypothetical protein
MGGCAGLSINLPNENQNGDSAMCRLNAKLQESFKFNTAAIDAMDIPEQKQAVDVTRLDRATA